MEERNCIGIIAEFDPFHRGHAHLIAQAKAALPGAPVVCAMSGPFTQRGEAAIVSKYARAEMALRCGADLVVELPVQWAVSSAESFARGGVQILHALGVTHLAFGSESGDLTALQAVAQVLDSDAFADALRPHLRQGLPFAGARQKALETLVGTETADCLTWPNNLLGIEYLRAIQTLAPEMRALTIPRVGVAHNAAGVKEGFAYHKKHLDSLAGAIAACPHISNFEKLRARLFRISPMGCYRLARAWGKLAGQN